MKNRIQELKNFYILWSTQSLSQLGSTMTSYALTLWLYQETGSALQTALLSICSYAPYVIMSVFAGAISDKWDKKRTMLACDTLAACSTVIVLFMLLTGMLRPWHLYLLNAISGLMNTVQNPASEVAITLITPKDQYQRTSGMRSFSRSLITILHPVIATALWGIGGMNLVIAVDLGTFAIAFLSLWLLVRIPEPITTDEGDDQESLLSSARAGLLCLKENRLVLYLIMFLSGVNLVASAFDAVLPAFILPHAGGGEQVLGAVTSFAGIAMLVGSVLATILPAPKDRIKVIILTMLFSLTADNFLMSLTTNPVLWCLAQVFGYLPVPLMETNLDVIVRSSIPDRMQGRVYACRNTLQFFTIPVGLFFGGFMVDTIFEPYMARTNHRILLSCFGNGKGSGAAMVIFLLGIIGCIVCLGFGMILRNYKPQD
ncbi:MAG: MFS transporter [Solobacterium sp.]|nr:MFS transporter [Solobacterium sp.]